MTADSWNAATAISRCPIAPWEGDVWRGHRRKYVASDASGSRRFSGRYNRGLDLVAEGLISESEVWSALYLALGPDVCIGEILRHRMQLSDLADFRLSRLHVRLRRVAKCNDLSLLGVSFEALCDDKDYAIPQSLAAAAIAHGAEAILVPSATRLGHNLVIFPEHLDQHSTIEVVDSIDPRLYVPRSCAARYGAMAPSPGMTGRPVNVVPSCLTPDRATSKIARASTVGVARVAASRQSGLWTLAPRTSLFT
jgi:RES domain-containing protein